MYKIDTNLYISAITCPEVSFPANGQVNFINDSNAPYDFGTIISYSCHSGFVVSGDLIRTCEGNGTDPNGTWSGTSPVCEGIAEGMNFSIDMGLIISADSF